MDDILLKDYIEQEKKYKTEALNASKDYLNLRGPRVNISKVQSIIHPLLKSYEYRVRIELRKAELNKTDTKALKSRLSDLERVTQIDFSNNPYVNGKITYGLCEEFSLEDSESYTLFHEVKNYLEKYSEPYDKDRLDLLFRITSLKTLVVSIKNGAVKKEQDAMQNALFIIDREMKTFKDLVIKNIFVAYSDFVHNALKQKFNSDYTSQLYLGHSPKYEDTKENAFDGFGEDAKNKTSVLLKADIASVDKDGFIAANYELNAIYNLLERRCEVEEILSLVERVEYALTEKNHTLISGFSKAMLDYDQAIISAQDLKLYCEVFIKKYENVLNSLKFNELEDRIDSSK